MNKSSQSKQSRRPTSWLLGGFAVLAVVVAAYGGYALNTNNNKNVSNTKFSEAGKDSTKINLKDYSIELNAISDAINSLQSDVRNLKGQVAAVQSNEDSTSAIDELRMEIASLRQENSRLNQLQNGSNYGVVDSPEEDVDTEMQIEPDISVLEQEFVKEQNMTTQWGSETQFAIKELLINKPDLGDIVTAECRGSSCKIESVHSKESQIMFLSNELSRIVDVTGQGVNGEIKKIVESDGRIRVTSYFQLDHQNPAISE